MRPLDRTSSTCVYKIVIFCTTYAWTHPFSTRTPPVVWAVFVYDPLHYATQALMIALSLMIFFQKLFMSVACLRSSNLVGDVGFYEMKG